MRERKVKERGGGGVLIENVKSSGLGKRGAIPETNAPYRKRQRTCNNITFKKT
jgi:hypothetical protein